MIRQEIFLASPWLNAPGTLGFAPPALWPVSQSPGGFVTNPISKNARKPAADRVCIPYPGGYLLHTGLPNPGFKSVLRHFSKRWSHSALPTWVHLIADLPDEVASMVEQLENIEGVLAIEMGLPPDVRTDEALSLVQAASGELPVVVEVPLSAVSESWVKKLPACGVSAITLGAPRGVLPLADSKLAQGRLYGPCLFPQVLACVRQMQPLGLPIIAGAGVYSRSYGEALLAAGAFAVQVDAALWLGDTFQWMSEPVND
jgi:dihydroorotate dehydrogenase